MKNKNTPVSLIVIALLILATVTQAQQHYIDSSVVVPQHPRLILLKGAEKIIRNNIAADKFAATIHSSIIAYSDTVLGLRVLQRIKIGRRLLDVSRECLRRVFYLAYSYRVTGQDRYAKRAEKELLAVCAFTDWNPGHFLDVAEMTLGVSIGYDWLHHALPESSRVIIKEAILKKGIEPSLESANNGWLKNTNNWNQVCNAGMAYGALATYEEHPALSRQIISRAIETMDLPMQQYAPDGAYPEGYGYWEYGTSFNVMFISALEAAFATDFGLVAKPGFLKTAAYLQNMTGATGRPFNYSDSREIPEFNPAMFWFAGRLKDPSLLWVSRQQLSGKTKLENRLLPAAMIWGKEINIANASAPKPRMWVGAGPNPVALMRTSWGDPKAIFVGFKGGSPSLSHAHMDAGSFVMEADGVRWGMDLGMQEYESLESKGISLWDGKQGSQRWQIFRYHNRAHNTITINDQEQLVKGSATIISHSASPQFMNVVADLTTLYNPAVLKLRRGVAVVDNSYVVVRDEVETGADSVTYRWSMVTPASVKILDSNSAELTKDGKKLLLRIESPIKITIKIWPTTPLTDYDAPNPGTSIVGYEVKLPSKMAIAISVSLVPQPAKSIKKTISLLQWPKE